MLRSIQKLEGVADMQGSKNKGLNGVGYVAPYKLPKPVISDVNVVIKEDAVTIDWKESGQPGSLTGDSGRRTERTLPLAVWNEIKKQFGK